MNAIDLSYLRQITEGDAKLEQELLHLFHATAERCISAMAKNFDSSLKDWSGIVHELNGAAATIGADTLRTLCAEAEYNAEASTRQHFYLNILKEYNKIETYLKNVHRS